MTGMRLRNALYEVADTPALAAAAARPGGMAGPVAGVPLSATSPFYRLVRRAHRLGSASGAPAEAGSTDV